MSLECGEPGPGDVDIGVVARVRSLSDGKQQELQGK